LRNFLTDTTMVRASRVESRTLTRQQLLESARAEIARAGYAGAAVETVAENAGFSKGAFYSNFDSKEELFLELMATFLRGQVNAFLAMLDSSNGDLESYLALKRQRMDEAVQDHEWSTVAVELDLHAQRSPVFAERYGVFHDTYVKAVSRIVRTLFASSGKTLPLPAEDLADALISISTALILTAKRRQQRQAGGAKFAGQVYGLILKSLIDAAPAKKTSPARR
jgi:AcrR family transcriptional regulator